MEQIKNNYFIVDCYDYDKDEGLNPFSEEYDADMRVYIVFNKNIQGLKDKLKRLGMKYEQCSRRWYLYNNKMLPENIAQHVEYNKDQRTPDYD